jgi:hypothetical protein
VDRLDADDGGRIRHRPLPVEGAPELIVAEFVDGTAEKVVADVSEQAVHDEGSEIPPGLNGLSSIDARACWGRSARIGG